MSRCGCGNDSDHRCGQYPNQVGLAQGWRVGLERQALVTRRCQGRLDVGVRGEGACRKIRPETPQVDQGADGDVEGPAGLIADLLRHGQDLVKRG